VKHEVQNPVSGNTACRQTIYDDAFIRQYIEDLLKNIRTQVVLKLIQPYTRIRIPFISKELNIPEGDVEQLLVSLILDSRIAGYIDQVTMNRPQQPNGLLDPSF
jgi:hypothetical protein